jgi:hypothetical protein
VRSRVDVAPDGYAGSDKNLIFEDHVFTNSRMRVDIASRADDSIFLNVDENANSSLIPDRAIAQVYQSGSRDLNFSTFFYVHDRHTRIFFCLLINSSERCRDFRVFEREDAEYFGYHISNIGRCSGLMPAERVVSLCCFTSQVVDIPPFEALTTTDRSRIFRFAVFRERLSPIHPFAFFPIVSGSVETSACRNDLSRII